MAKMGGNLYGWELKERSLNWDQHCKASKGEQFFCHNLFATLVVAQLAERSVLTPEIRSLKSSHRQNFTIGISLGDDGRSVGRYVFR